MATGTTSTVLAAPFPMPAQGPSLTLPFNENYFTNDSQWQVPWGTATTTPTGFLALAPIATGTGASVILNASSSDWKDYKFEATIDWVNGETFNLAARYIDPGNYVACVFDKPDQLDLRIYLEQFINGAPHVLATAEALNYTTLDPSNVDAYIDVHGTAASCSLNNHYVSSMGTGFTVNPPFNGGIGVGMWDPNPGASALIVKNVSVTETNQ